MSACLVPGLADSDSLECWNRSNDLHVLLRVPQCFHSRVSDEPKWIASLTDMKVRHPVNANAKRVKSC